MNFNQLRDDANAFGCRECQLKLCLKVETKTYARRKFFFGGKKSAFFFVLFLKSLKSLETRKKVFLSR